VVGVPDAVGEASKPTCREGIGQLGEDAYRSARVVKDRRSHLDRGSTGDHELERIQAGFDPTHTNDRYVGQRGVQLPDATHCDRLYRGTEQATGVHGERRTHQSTSMTIPSSVLIADSPSAPAATHARLMDTTSVTRAKLREDGDVTGKLARTASTTAPAATGSQAKTWPRSSTLGREM
jgi:hypothetical protein